MFPRLIAFALTIAFGSTFAVAADVKGCSDVLGLKRFAGSQIVICEKRNFAEYTLPTGKVRDFDFKRRKADFEASLDLEGKLTQNVYAAPIGVSAAEVSRNYKLDLEAKGFKVLYEAKGLDFGYSQGSVFGDGPGNQIFAYSGGTSRYLAAVKDDGGAQLYLALYVIEFQDGSERQFQPEKNQVMVRLDAVEVGELKDRMVVVSAAEIARSIETTGKVTIYGVYFDFNRATIKPESRPALEEMGHFLKANGGARVFIVGHTDSVGGYDFNVKLSQARAISIVDALAKDYRIAPDRLRATGVAFTSPVAPNTTEDGRAKNRRVEMVPQ